MTEHLLKNFDELLRKVTNEVDKEARMIALTLLEEAVRAADPRIAIRNHVKLSKDGETLKVDEAKFNLKTSDQVYVVGGGKASGAMAEEVEKLLGENVSGGCVSILSGTRNMFHIKSVELRESSHPIPGNENVEATKRILTITDKATPKDTILCLFSGGGSALFSLPLPSVKLEDFQEVVRQLLKRGATINELNAVRKHLSQVSGGRLAERLASKGCTVIVLVISDVVGDPLDVVAGGPTAPDTTTFKEAIEVLKRYGLWIDTPESVKQHMLRGLSGQVPETPKPESKIFNHIHNFIIGSCRQACYAAHSKARELKLNSIVLSTMVEGEARQVGKVTAGIAKELAKYNSPIKRPAAMIMGGETTVTVRGEGKGGRNQELALSASKSIEGLSGIAIASMGTDGVDGPTDAAGAIVDGSTVTHARAKNMNVDEYLARNDSNTFFKSLGDGLIMTGSTGTNVNDIILFVAL
nr:glycerate kinase [Candidatus Njordarchaeum guaymaensis]